MPRQSQISVTSSLRRKRLPPSLLRLPPALHLQIQWKAVNFLLQNGSKYTLPSPFLRPLLPVKDLGRHHDQTVNLLRNR
jgi:hypothetical protein